MDPGTPNDRVPFAVQVLTLGYLLLAHGCYSTFPMGKVKDQLRKDRSSSNPQDIRGDDRVLTVVPGGLPRDVYL